MKIRILSSAFLFCTIIACGQSSQRITDKFFNYLNTYEQDSLGSLLTDDFRLERSYNSYSNNKESFLSTYLSKSKAIHAKFNVLKILSKDPGQFLVEDESDLLDILEIRKPTWKIIVSIKNSKINKIIIDSTETTSGYIEEAGKKVGKFEDWLIKAHPGESMQELYFKEGLIVKRLKEYKLKK